MNIKVTKVFQARTGSAPNTSSLLLQLLKPSLTPTLAPNSWATTPRGAERDAVQREGDWGGGGRIATTRPPLAEGEEAFLESHPLFCSPTMMT